MLIFVMVHSSVWAATWTVDPSDTSASPDISSAIELASSGDRIEIVAGLYSECVDTVGKDLEIEGISGSASTIVEGSGDCESTWVVREGERLELTGLTVRHEAGRGFEFSGSRIVLDDVAVDSSGTEELDGGGIYLAGGNLEAQGLVLRSNIADRGGNLLVTNGALVALTNSSISLGEASRGGGIFVLDGTGGSGEIMLDGCTIEGNTSAADGGGVYLESGALLDSRASLYQTNQPEQGDGGAVYLGWASTLTSADDVFVENGSVEVSGTWGGAIALASYAGATIERGSFRSNRAGNGGAISASYDNTLSMDSCLFEDNLADWGGGLAIEDGGSLSDTDSRYVGNIATTAGGAIWARDLVSVVLSGPDVESNMAEGEDGGGFWFSELASLSIRNADFSENYAGLMGGALWIESMEDPVVLDELLFLGNMAVAGSGGALGVRDLSLDSIRMDFQDNRSETDGGAIWANNLVDWSLSDSSFVLNQAGSTGQGGAIWMSFVENLEFADNHFCANSAEFGGAAYGFYLHGSDVWLRNIFRENHAGDDGGGVYIDYAASQRMQNNTWVGNGAEDEGGSLWLTVTASTLVNNIVSHTWSGGGLHVDDADSAASSSYSYGNWFDNISTDESGYATLDPSSDGHLWVDPEFVDYTMDGDCTNDVLDLSMDSPLVDAGDPSILDEDGSVSDIGALGPLKSEEDPMDTGDPGTGDSGNSEDTAQGDTADSDTGVGQARDSGASDSSGFDSDTVGSEGSTPWGPVEDTGCGCGSGIRSKPIGFDSCIWFCLAGFGYWRRRDQIQSGRQSNHSAV